MRRSFVFVLVAVLLGGLLAACSSSEDTLGEAPLDLAARDRGQIGINVLLDGPLDRSEARALSAYGRILDQLDSINALTMRASAADIAAIQSLPFVVAANADAERGVGPIATTVADVLENGLSTWHLDAVDVTDGPKAPPFVSTERTLDLTGEGVFVAVIDTGLMRSWASYFPVERIATEYARSFGGGGGERGNVSEQPNKWEHDVDAHGTHVTSTILGYSYRGAPITGVSPNVTVIPIKALNQNGSGWSSVVARAVEDVGDLKAPGGDLENVPVVINMSLGGSALDAVEKAAIDYAIGQGVVIVASAGNAGLSGMGYPGAYEPVVSVAASGWVGEWQTDEANQSVPWWIAADVPEGVDGPDPSQFYITGFSSRERTDQDLDVAAPGSWIVGPYQINQGQLGYYYLGGTSMASPHVAGIAALLLEKDPTLTASDVEKLLTENAIPFEYASPDGTECRSVVNPFTDEYEDVCWSSHASGHGLVNTLGTLAAMDAD